MNETAQMEWAAAVLLQLSALVAQSTACHTYNGVAGWQLECSYEDADYCGSTPCFHYPQHKIVAHCAV